MERGSRLGFEDGTVEVIASGTARQSHSSWKANPHRIDLLYFFPDGKSLFVGPVDSPGQVWDLTDIQRCGNSAGRFRRDRRLRC